jgi:hypothetical protein
MSLDVVVFTGGVSLIVQRKSVALLKWRGLRLDDIQHVTMIPLEARKNIEIGFFL